MNIGMGWEYKSPPREIDNKMAIRIDEKFLPEQEPHVEPSATHHDFGTECAGSEQTQSRGCWGSPAW